jgi:hypothetical protein
MWNMSGAPHGNHVDIIQAIAERNIPFITLIMWTLPRQTWALYIPRKGKFHIICEYLHSESLRREIHEALQVIENWNSANGFIFYGKGGELATNRFEDQEISMLALQLLQNSLVLMNTLMLQKVLEEPSWLQRMTPDDWRGLSPLIYHHINPYGLFRLDMATRINLDAAA